MKVSQTKEGDAKCMPGNGNGHREGLEKGEQRNVNADVLQLKENKRETQCDVMRAVAAFM